MRRSAAWSIARREVRALFESPGGYLILGTFWLVAGMLLLSLLFQYREESLRLAQGGQVRSGPAGIHVNDAVVQPLLLNLGSILAFFVPLLTMRTFAEERRSGSLELLLSQPVRGVDVLAGKTLGALASLGICLSILLVHAVVLLLVSSPDWPALLAGLVGLLLLGLLFTAAGVLLSVLSRSQVEAAVLTLGGLLAATIGPGAARPGSPAGEAIVGFLSIMGRFEEFTRGLLDLGNVAFFVGATLLLLAAGLRALDLVRWQG